MKTTGICAPIGYLASGIACGIKSNDQKDLSIVYSTAPAIAAGVFTKNVIKGHSLLYTKNNIENKSIRAIVINSGNANACLGQKGDNDALKMAELTAFYLSVDKEEILLGSTGVIGHILKMGNIEEGIKKASKILNIEGGLDAASAIMTTDLVPKQSSVSFDIGGKNVTIGAMAKGSGMIHPDMATMIAIITTDINIKRELLNLALIESVNKSFNRISVDGDTSVCDMVIILSNKMAKNTIINKKDENYNTFLSHLTKICIEQSKMIVKDGEGATKMIELIVNNAQDADSAHKILNAVSTSPLFKTAMFGEDANWGRILTAIGYSNGSFNPDKVDIFIGDLCVCKNGKGQNFDEKKAKNILSKEEILIVIDLKDGLFKDKMWTCDFSYDYVKINGSYRT